MTGNSSIDNPYAGEWMDDNRATVKRQPAAQYGRETHAEVAINKREFPY
jgi:hypothetical protein